MLNERSPALVLRKRGSYALASYYEAMLAALDAGAPVRPKDLTPIGVVDRPARGLVRALRTARGRWQPPASVSS